jgi:uncharacterized repeat protein (TIGR01451 family)
MSIIFKKDISNVNRMGIVVLLFMTLTVPKLAFSQFRNYNLVYSDNIKGGTAMFGNTLLHIINGDTVNTTKMNDNSANGNSVYGNDNENMQYIDIDGNTGIGTVTRNSSSADLILPMGNNIIKLARLYWGGRVKNVDYDLSVDSNKTIKIRKITNNKYADVTALGIDKTMIVTGYTQYQAYADITDLIKTNGAGTYEVGNAPLSTGPVSDGGNNGGWCIVVVYENDAINYNSVRLYDGFEQVYSNGNPLSTTVTLTGLDVPSGVLAPGDAKMGVLAWEGDANLNKDYLKINSNLFSNATNPADNMWNGTITDNGAHVKTKNPNYTNQMGIDIDQFDIGTGYGIVPNTNSVMLEFGTEADKYFPGVFAFTIRMKDPTITLDKTVQDANNNHMGEPNEILTYTLRGENSGPGNANSIIITDTLPSTVTYLPNSLNIISASGTATGFQSDNKGDDLAEYITNGAIKTVIFRLGKGASSTTGGTLAAGESYEVQFKVTVNDPGNGNRVPSIMNIARINAQSDANVKFVDDGTAIINPEAGALPVTLVSFTATLMPDNNVSLNWATSQEINCDKYKIERGFDGNLFSEVASLSGSGTTSLFHSYSFTDNVFQVSVPLIYYRIKQIDIDGKGTYSKVLSIKLKSANDRLTASPNPFTSSVNISIGWASAENVSARIFNIQGKEMLMKNVRLSAGVNNISFDELSKFPAGNYFIQFISGAHRITQKITKQ